MAATIGNQFWKLRSKHGRDKIFESPELLWEEACKYFQWCDENPLLEAQQSRGRATKKEIELCEGGLIEKDSGLIELPRMRAYTWEGLELYLDITDEGLRNYRKNEKYKDFFGVLTRISNIIYSQKFTGAASGFFNHNIIARDLDLIDKRQETGSINISISRNVAPSEDGCQS